MTRCIVVIEDEPEILQILRDVLELEEFHVIGVARPDLVHTAVGAIRPDVFLIDVMLPGMSGVEVAQQLRDAGHTTPMIAMSASKLMLHVAMGEGVFQDAIDKPFDLSLLLDTLDRHLAGMETLC